MKRLLVFLILSFVQPVFSENYETMVESDEAYYDGEIITLIGNVRVANAMGKIYSQKAVLRKDESKATRLDFPWIELSMNVSVSLTNGERLECASLFIDYTKMTSQFKGEPHVVFKDDAHEIYAEEAIIDYEEREGSIKPVKVFLTKNVHMIYQGSLEKPEEQFALADEMIYFPDEQLMILEGKESKVLFYDKKRDMQLSTKTVHASKNKETNKESIRGVGDVRFIFGPEELEKIRNRFQWEEK